jgi:polysaccharide chain length determinant protein (PEP-CTERM system associated)
MENEFNDREFNFRKILNLLPMHKQLFAIVALAIMSGVVVITYIIPKKYEARSIFFVEQNVLKDLVAGIGGTPSNSEADTQRELISSSKLLQKKSLMTKVINDLGLNLKIQGAARFEETIIRLQKKTNIDVDNRDGLITVSFIDKNPRFARDYVNALVRRFIEDNLSTKREESSGATSFISEQIALYKEKIDKADAEINNFRREKGALLSSESVNSQSEIGTVQQRLDDLILKRSQLEAMRKHLKSNNPARAKLLALQKRLEELRVDYTDKYPEVLKVKADIEAAKTELNGSSTGSSSVVTDPSELERIEAELQAVRISEANERAILANSRGLLWEGPRARATLEKMIQERNKYGNIYDQLVAKGGQAEVTKQMEMQNKSPSYRIVEPAQLPVIPISPNRVNFILLGIVAGIAGGFVLLLAINYFDRTVKTADTLKELGVQVVATIPKIIDPKLAGKERRRDLRLYIASGAYFSMILALLVLEVMNLSPVERIIGLING